MTSGLPRFPSVDGFRGPLTSRLPRFPSVDGKRHPPAPRAGAARRPGGPGSGSIRCSPGVRCRHGDPDRGRDHRRPAGGAQPPGRGRPVAGRGDAARDLRDRRCAPPSGRSAGLGRLPGARPRPARRGRSVRLHEARVPGSDRAAGSAVRGDLGSPVLGGRTAGVQRQGRGDRVLHGRRLRPGGRRRRLRRRRGQLRDDPRRRRRGARAAPARSSAATAPRTGPVRTCRRWPPPSRARGSTTT